LGHQLHPAESLRTYDCYRVCVSDRTAIEAADLVGGEPIGSHFPRSNHDASLLAIETLLGWVSESKELIEALDG
jgi:hypothetical protein